jgi:hypothetical protein
MKRDTTLPWIEDENYFKHMCALGRKYEAIIMQRLVELGVDPADIQLLDDGFRDNPEQIASFSENSKDLLIKGWPFEVKSRNVSFTEPDDWPEIYWPMFLDTVRGFEAKKSKPVGYIFISQQTQKLMATSTARKPEWTKQKKFDRDRKIWDEFYCIDRDLVIDEEALTKKLLEMRRN